MNIPNRPNQPDDSQEENTENLNPEALDAATENEVDGEHEESNHEIIIEDAPLIQDSPEELVFNLEKWSQTKLSDELIAVIQKAGFLSPTPVQEAAIPLALSGKDLLVSARTGSGKTACFALPMLEKIKRRKGTLGLVLCPTREIALQTLESIKIFGEALKINSMAVIGGVNIRQEEEALREYPQVIVGTPGRICDHLDRGNIWLEYVEHVILDEADRMLEMGFSQQLNRIVSDLSSNRQTMFFSATFSKETEKLAEKYLVDPERISLGSSLSVADSVAQELLWVNEENKTRELVRILDEQEGSVIVFVRTKHQASSLWKAVSSKGHRDSSYLSSEKEQKYREEALARFKDGRIRVLITTDVAGRGIHVDDVTCVINYDFPSSVEDYIHRVGRTGRKEQSGRAVTFVTPSNSKQLIQVEKTIKMTIPERRAFDYVFRGMQKRSHAGGRGGRSGGPARRDSGQRRKK